ncbi:MAG: recombinase family protein [Mobiluncus porci]|uniref:recombinase family protein n=1 Tax=Mobiluncus porci TaxID=2652278 RepID=UPI0023EF9C47|nr:recombinase family protein [Mobiluncus porci]MDD7542468.1 recombinase family protein [Mobiluncus porci]MDY5748765.1 recombinase family protein [Mobiluncus porci]
MAAYARVSTDSEEQATSYEAQVDYYTGLIQSRADWELADIYTDEGITGTSTKHRDGFNRMVKDAMEGKIDLILTKSVSRFARNTVDSLTTVRTLKERGVEIFFEKENIWTLDSKGELLITIMSSLAQEESRSISENVRWGMRKRMADGQVYMPYPHFLGYEKGPDGRPAINEEEAKIVRRIFSMFLSGDNPNKIARTLTRENVRLPGNRGKQWYAATVTNMLKNEKYKGDAILQKSFVADFLTKRQEKNRGQLPQYYVSGSHEAIIDPETWELVQYELEVRRKVRDIYPFTSKLKCDVCGAWYGSKTWHSNDKYRSIIWQCNNKYKVKHPKGMPHFNDADVREAFCRALTEYLRRAPAVIEGIEASIEEIMDTQALEDEQTRWGETLEELGELMNKAVENNSRKAQNQAEYQDKFQKLQRRYEKASARYQELGLEIRNQKGKALQMKAVIDVLKNAAPTNLFNQRLWHILVNHATVQANGTITFTFKDGSEIPA